MRLRYPLFVFIFFIANSAIFAQTTLFHEDFNECILPAGWETAITGNPNPVYYVGINTNNDQNGGSMNGSCFLFIDDDAVGNNTPPYVIEIRTPVFDLSQFPTEELTLDVHYRDWASAPEYFSVSLWDGTQEIELRRFAQGQSTGDSLHEYITLKYDLALLSHSTEARLIFRYDDAAGFNWWAGVDNINIVGYGNGTNVVAETFNQCTKPAGWETEILTGDFDWVFGKATNPKAGNGTTMDGTCMAFFDDDILGDTAVYSTARLYTPWFDGTQFGRFSLDFDLILRYAGENILVYVQNGFGQESLVHQYTDDVGGPSFSTYEHEQFDISAFRSQQMRVVFEYTDGNVWGWWAGVDNVKITGEGAANDLCTQASELTTGAACVPADNRTAIFDGPQPACSEKVEAGLWFKWVADFSGIAQVQTRANFNDVVNVYTGTCAVLEEQVCNNRDEHGFTGETTYFNAVAGTEYLLRVSGQSTGFGTPRGVMCVDLQQVPALPPTPPNEDCATASPLSVNGACLAGDNLNAGTSTVVPSANERARADIWYSFTAPALAPGDALEIESNADFSDIITAYTGGCADLQEVATEFKGGKLKLTGLTEGQVYYVQIAGNFATVEGHCCVNAATKTPTPSPNNACANALHVGIGEQCTAAQNLDAAFTGVKPPCVLEVYSDLWFSFTAPASGIIRFNANAEFEQVAAVWQGDCNALTPVACFENPRRCDGYITVGGLVAGQTYFIQIAAQHAANTGNCCLKITDGALPAEFQPLSLNVLEQCNGLGTAILSISAVGGVAPFTFQGEPAGSTLSSGDAYLVVATDAMGCVQSVSGIVDECTQACALNAAITPTAQVCDGPTGALTASVTGGTEPYTYAWSGGQTGASISGLAAGTYTVTVIDALGCATVLNATLAEGADFAIAVGQLEHPIIGQNNGNIYVEIAGDNNGLQFAWSDSTGTVIAATHDLIGVGAGIYTLVVQSPEGCTKTLQATLSGLVSSNNPVGDALNISLYPNPASDNTTLVLRSKKPETWQISIADPLGRLIYTNTVGAATQADLPLILSNWQPGAYLIQVETSAGVHTKKLIIGR